MRVNLFVTVFVVVFTVSNAYALLSIRPTQVKGCGDVAYYQEGYGFAIFEDPAPRRPLMVIKVPPLAVRFVSDTGPVNNMEKETQSGLTDQGHKAETLNVSVEKPVEVEVLFKFNSDILMDSEKEKLRGISGTVSVYGYTCDIGSASYNLKLSERRAKRVAHWLMSQGVNVIEYRGFGECCPKETRELSRRAVIKIHSQKGGEPR